MVESTNYKISPNPEGVKNIKSQASWLLYSRCIWHVLSSYKMTHWPLKTPVFQVFGDLFRKNIFFSPGFTPPPALAIQFTIACLDMAIVKLTDVCTFLIKTIQPALSQPSEGVIWYLCIIKSDPFPACNIHNTNLLNQFHCFKKHCPISTQGQSLVGIYNYSVPTQAIIT